MNKTSHSEEGSLSANNYNTTNNSDMNKTIESDERTDVDDNHNETNTFTTMQCKTKYGSIYFDDKCSSNSGDDDVDTTDRIYFTDHPHMYCNKTEKSFISKIGKAKIMLEYQR